MTTKFFTITAAVLTLAACADMYPPAMVADLTEDRVLVQAGAWNEPAEIQRVASSNCAIHGREARGPIQRYEANVTGWTYLFACTAN